MQAYEDFVAEHDGLTGTGFEVVLTGGDVEECDVTWRIAEAATLTDSHFIGRILAGAGITLTRGTFDGYAWAGASEVGDVTITGTAVTGCEDGSRGRPRSIPPGDRLSSSSASRTRLGARWTRPAPGNLRGKLPPRSAGGSLRGAPL